MADAGRRPLASVRQERSLKEQAYETLREGIVDGRLPAGSLHSVQSIATALKVSRTPVREALIDLEARGMVSFERNHGVRILETSPHDLEEIFVLRVLLEVPAARRAPEHITATATASLRATLEEMDLMRTDEDPGRVLELDRHFHRQVLEASGNRRLAEYVDHLRDLILVRGVSTAGHTRSLGMIVDEHWDILDAIERRDPAAAASAMKQHLEQTARLLLGGDAERGESTRDESRV